MPFFGGVGVQEILIILVVGLLVFGAGRLPKIAKSLGQGIKEFKKSIQGLGEEEEEGKKARYIYNQPPPDQMPQYGQSNPSMQNPNPGQYYGPYPPNYQPMGGGPHPGPGYSGGGPQTAPPGQSQAPGDIDQQKPSQDSSNPPDESKKS